MIRAIKKIVALVGLAILITPSIAHAGVAEDIANAILTVPINIFTSLFAQVVAWFASLLNWTFSVQTVTGVPVIQFAWSVSRDLANMFFILLLLIIAFATILRYEPYGVKRLLPKLLIVALLINFSMVGAGVIIDMGSTLGYFFVSGGNPEVGDIGANIAAAIGIPRLAEFDDEAFLGISKEDTIGNSFMRLIFTIVVAFLFIAMAGLMIVRLVALWVLVMFVPLALIAWILPAGQKYWSQWWSKFFGWAFFPAIFGIFIYFGVIIGSAFNNNQVLNVTGGEGLGAVQSSGLPMQIQHVLQYIIVIMIMLAGLTQAKKAGLEGADLAVKWGGKAKDAALGYTKSGAKFAGKTAVKATPEPLRRKLREGAEKTPILGRAIGGPGARHKEFVKRVKEAEKEMKDLRPQDLRAIANQKVATEEGRARRAAAIKQLAEKGKLEEGDKQFFGDYLTAGGDAKVVLQNMPNWIMDEGVQKALAHHPATRADWAGTQGMPSGSAGRVELAKSAYRKKMLPQKPKEFSKTSKAAINIYDEEISGRELQARREILHMYVEEFKEGGRFHANVLSAMANDNPQAYEVLVRRLKERNIYPTLQEGVRNFIDKGPMAAWIEPTAGAEPTETPNP